ncbi:hypothetical protein [Streptomyces thinghirensis]|uniref:Uncharacterized protein n=1 Tax=Streptomyces thinghirensis TaxID=551547 RepID=A0ABP9TFH9_9ACTN
MGFLSRNNRAREIADEVVVTWRLDSADANRRAAEAVEAKADRLEGAGDRRGAEQIRSWAGEARRVADSMDRRG